VITTAIYEINFVKLLLVIFSCLQASVRESWARAVADEDG